MGWTAGFAWLGREFLVRFGSRILQCLVGQDGGGVRIFAPGAEESSIVCMF